MQPKCQQDILSLNQRSWKSFLVRSHIVFRFYKTRDSLVWCILYAGLDCLHEKRESLMLAECVGALFLWKRIKTILSAINQFSRCFSRPWVALNSSVLVTLKFQSGCFTGKCSLCNLASFWRHFWLIFGLHLIYFLLLTEGSS